MNAKGREVWWRALANGVLVGLVDMVALPILVGTDLRYTTIAAAAVIIGYPLFLVVVWTITGWDWGPIPLVPEENERG